MNMINLLIGDYFEILNYLVLIFITILYSKALDYRLLAATFFVNLIPIIFHVKDYDFYDAMFLICSNLFVGGAFGSLLYIRNESIYEVFYLLLLDKYLISFLLWPNR